MLEKLAAIKDWTSATWNKVKVVGPYLIAQSEKMSVAWQEHQRRLAAVRVEEEAENSEIRIREETRLAEVEVFKAATSAELAGRVELRNSLFARMVEAPPEERIELERKIEHLDGSTRILGLALKSTDYQSGGGTDSGKEIEGHWIDTFNDLARKRNEDWRNELLARALAKEAEKPGSVSPRALWTIGNLDEASFGHFSDFLDLCVWPFGGADAFIPMTAMEPGERITKSGESVAAIAFLLGDLGLLASEFSNKVFERGVTYRFRHGPYGVQFTPMQEIHALGALLSPLGASIASFYKREWNDGGRQVLSDWIEFLGREEVEVRRLKVEDPSPAQNI